MPQSEINRFLQNHQKEVFRYMAFGCVVNGFALAAFVMRVERLQEQANFLVDIVNRNMDKLDDFDIIAMRELGMLKTVKND